MEQLTIQSFCLSYRASRRYQYLHHYHHHHYHHHHHHYHHHRHNRRHHHHHGQRHRHRHLGLPGLSLESGQTSGPCRINIRIYSYLDI